MNKHRNDTGSTLPIEIFEQVFAKAQENTATLQTRQEEAFRHSFPGAGGLSLMWEAQAKAQVCGCCGSLFGEEGDIWRVGVTLPGLTGWATHIVPMCEHCRPERSLMEGRWSWGEPKPCEGCHRWVWNREHALARWERKHTYCSSACERKAVLNTRREKRAKARQKVCGICGEPFQGARSDAEYCSSACRQKAYRLRKKGENDGAP